MCLRNKVFLSEANKALILAVLKLQSAKVHPVAAFTLVSYSVTTEAKQYITVAGLHIHYIYIHLYPYARTYIEIYMVCHH